MDTFKATKSPIILEMHLKEWTYDKISLIKQRDCPNYGESDNFLSRKFSFHPFVIQKEKSSLIERGVSSTGYKGVARVMFSRILKEYFKTYLMVLQHNKVCSGALLQSKAEQR